MKFEDKWWLHFVPECYFDTVLLKKLLDTNKRLLHVKGCANVTEIFTTGHLKDDFGVGVIDKDKKELRYLEGCSMVYKGVNDDFVVSQEVGSKHFIIQLNPPIENWILKRLEELGKRIEDYQFPADPKMLKNLIKNDLDSEQNDRLQKLVNTIAFAGNKVVEDLKRVLIFLKNNNYNTDFKKL